MDVDPNLPRKQSDQNARPEDWIEKYRSALEKDPGQKSHFFRIRTGLLASQTAFLAGVSRLLGRKKTADHKKNANKISINAEASASPLSLHVAASARKHASPENAHRASKRLAKTKKSKAS